MNWIEIIQLRAYSQQERDAARAAFQEMTLPDRESGLGDIYLFRNMGLDTDLCILIYW